MPGGIIVFKGLWTEKVRAEHRWVAAFSGLVRRIGMLHDAVFGAQKDPVPLPDRSGDLLQHVPERFRFLPGVKQLLGQDLFAALADGNSLQCVFFHSHSNTLFL